MTINTATLQVGHDEKQNLSYHHDSYGSNAVKTATRTKPATMAYPNPSRSGSNMKTRRRWFVSAFVAMLCFVLLAHIITDHNDAVADDYGITLSAVADKDDGPSATPEPLKLQKPQDVKIIGLVFFGRKSRVEILRCYLERNLVDNGGWLDEIHWIRNTDKHNDLDYLDEIVASSLRYKVIGLNGVGFVGYAQAWKHMERGNLYVKIDDDVVYIAEDTIPRIVSMKLAESNAVLVSANMINSPLLGWVHYHMGAIHPYLPELTTPETTPSPSLFTRSPPTQKPWRYTTYPPWTGPTDYFFGTFQAPPSSGHRWLRLPHPSNITQTPIVDAEYSTWGKSLKSWAIAAQQHYSFLENLADDNLHLYKTGHSNSGGGKWITNGQRLSINLIALWADDILDNLPMTTVDEEWLTVVLPRKLGRQVLVNTDALAAHFTFGTQGLVEQTDLLPRYKDYAVENFCAKKTG